MGQKVPPKANRLGYIEDWTSKWFDLKATPQYVEEDYKIRENIKKNFRSAIVCKIIIQRLGKQMIVDIETVRPGIIIGKGGENINEITKYIESITGYDKVMVRVTEVAKPQLNAQAVAEFIALALEKNMNYRRVIKNAIDRTMSEGALGIKIRVSGRLAGVEIARSEWFREGRIPTNTFRAVIDYGFSEAIIKKGKIGIKVWIFLKELLTEEEQELYRMGKLYELLGGGTNVNAEQS